MTGIKLVTFDGGRRASMPRADAHERILGRISRTRLDGTGERMTIVDTMVRGVENGRGWKLHVGGRRLRCQEEGLNRLP
jgi:hypothetical protein